MKREIRLLGFDDFPFDKFNEEKVRIIGTFFRGGDSLDGVLSAKVEVDGDDATVQLIKLINKSKFKSQVQAILLDGIAFGGFNIINIEALNKHTKIPAIVVIRRYPDFKKIKATLKKLNMEKKIKLIEKAGQPKKVNQIYIQYRGLTLTEAKEIIKISSTRSYIPEPIRVAHLIGQGFYFGESRGKA